MDENEVIVKGGVCWFEISFSRGYGGLEVSVKSTPQLETFMKSLEGPEPSNNLTIYGKNWYPIGKEINVYGLSKELPRSTYALGRVCESLESSKDGITNLSFLRFVGISDPQGVRFGISGPFSKDIIKSYSKKIVDATRSLIKDYVVPVHINLRISSQEI